MADKNMPQTQFIPAVHGYFAIEKDGDYLFALPVVGFLIRIDDEKAIDYTNGNSLTVYPVGISGILNDYESILTPEGLLIDRFSEGAVSQIKNKELIGFDSIEDVIKTIRRKYV